MKIDRLMGIVTILLQQDKVTAPELAWRFEVSRRTINRDIEDICRAGIPLVTIFGYQGGPQQTNVMSFKPQPRITPSFFRCLQLVYGFFVDNREPACYNGTTIYWRTRIFKVESHT